MFMSYAIMTIAIWACCTVAAIHFNNVFILVFAIIGMACMPEFRRTHGGGKSE